ncbi:hypothetical protein AB0B45_38570 [Nonomuraea sp. NPDC049152]|uniref:hypothetical protein n=1 Tax=Nonomuraea sp. NPDC049152 TaxID=3154350 RepID=UPI0033E611E5
MAASEVSVHRTLRSSTEDGVQRFIVFIITLMLVGALLAVGMAWPSVATVTIAAMVGGIEIARRLTAPQDAPVVRILVIVVICVTTTVLLWQNYPPILTTAAVLGGTLGAGEIARRYAGFGFRLPRLVY